MTTTEPASMTPPDPDAVHDTPTPPLDLDAITARAEAATEGPWAVQPDIHGDPRIVEEGKWFFTGGGIAECVRRDDYGRSNAGFIAHARTDVPALVEEVKRLREGVATRAEWSEISADWTRMRAERDVAIARADAAEAKVAAGLALADRWDDFEWSSICYDERDKGFAHGFELGLKRAAADLRDALTEVQAGAGEIERACGLCRRLGHTDSDCPSNPESWPAPAPVDDREALTGRLVDELEYRVRTAAALAKGGYDINGEVKAGRLRVAAILAAGYVKGRQA